MTTAEQKRLAEKSLGEKLEKLVSPAPSKWYENATYRQANRGWLRKSRAVALRVLAVLDEKKMTQATLAEKNERLPATC